MSSRSTPQTCTPSAASLRAARRESFERWIDGLIRRLQAYTATAPWERLPERTRAGRAQSAIATPDFAGDLIGRLADRLGLANRDEAKPQARTGRHLHKTLAVADADHEFLRVIQRARGGLRLIPYMAAAPLLAEARAARAVSGSAPWDAALITLGLPDLNGNSTIAQMRALHPGLKIWATVGVEESHTLIGAICAGADGYIVKCFNPGAASAELRALDQDQPPLGRKLAVSLLQLAGDSLWPRESSGGSQPPLQDCFSRAQNQLLRLIARGDSIATAGERMTLTDGGAHAIVRQIYGLLQTPQLRASVPEALREQTRAHLAHGRGSIEIG